MIDDLLVMWTELTSGNLYQNWNWGILNGLFFKQGLFDTQPLRDYIEAYYQNRTLHRLLHFNSVDAITGNIVTFDETSDRESFVTGLCGSTAVPFVFPPVKFGDKLLMDGGVAWNLDIASAVLKCHTLVDSDSKIFLDVIDVDRGLSNLPEWNSTGNTISNYLRFRKLKDYYHRIDDEVEIQAAFPDVNYRYLIVPKVQLDHIYQELSLDHELV